MKTFEIETFIHFHQAIERYEERFTVFRGSSNAAHELIPKIGRANTRLKAKAWKREKKMLDIFKDRALPHLRFNPRNDWEWLALLQHHGGLTRLLDWSRNPLVAAYFAVEKDVPTDSVVYAWRSKKEPISAATTIDPFSIKAVEKYIPAHLSERIIAQAGLFTVHPDPKVPMQSPNLEKLIIRNSFRKPFKDVLFKYGVHRASLFPSLDGLADHITWMNVESH